MRKKQYRLHQSDLSSLLENLRRRGYQPYGPQRRDHAIEWLPLDGIHQLPAGWTTTTAPATYRMQERSDQALFGYWTGPDSLKKLLHPPEACLLKAEYNGGVRFVRQAPAEVKRAFIGVRACDLAAVAALDRVLLSDRWVDDIYQANRNGALLIAVNCTSSAPTCFCASMGSGPRARSGYDIALTERVGDGSSEFLAEPGSEAGASILEELTALAAPAGWEKEAEESCQSAAAAQTRAVDASSAPAVIDRTFDHPRWDQTARRCLACGNCTSVCPTCFCVNIEERNALDLRSAERLRVWDSCFTQAFTYIHGGSIRTTPKSRYRQWLSHKLARWQEQFGMPGCTGCGRCIAWCPAGIDITEEMAALEASSGSTYPTGVSTHGN
ncbi:MAG: 4Fe-4S dicluster domain-containing protein [Acidobacteria bacterium]|nr:4Fe-4S dicluster domain-containing protein [Acidobacteriota bacterium]